jgi:hypothetical protein
MAWAAAPTQKQRQQGALPSSSAARGRAHEQHSSKLQQWQKQQQARRHRHLGHLGLTRAAERHPQQRPSSQ